MPKHFLNKIMAKISKKYTIGVDIGGTKMKAILFDGKHIIMEYILATPKDSFNHFLIMLKALLDPLFEKAQNDKIEILGIGLGVAGIIEKNHEIIINSPNIPVINNINLVSKLKEIINLPIKMDNDANCFVRAESMLKLNKKYKNIYGLIIGTGIGGGWWVNNSIYYGSFGSDNEPGRMIINFNDNTKLEEAYQKLTQFNAANMAENAYKGDLLAQKKYEELGVIIGQSIANISNIIDPEIFVLGGGVVESADLFINSIKITVKNCFKLTPNKKNLKIIKSHFGNNAGAIGAALLFNS